MKAANRKMSVDKWRRKIEEAFAGLDLDSYAPCGHCEEYDTCCVICPLYDNYRGIPICDGGEEDSWYTRAIYNNDLDAALIIWEAVQTL